MPAIAANDPRLAQGATRDLLREIGSESRSAIARERRRTGPINDLKAYRRGWTGRIVYESVQRENGSRALWMMAALLPSPAGLDLVVARHASGVTVCATLVHWTLHSLARSVQRTLHSADEHGVHALVQPFAGALVDPRAFVALAREVDLGEVVVMNEAGAFLGRKDPGKRLQLATWVPAEMFHAKQRAQHAQITPGSTLFLTEKEMPDAVL